MRIAELERKVSNLTFKVDTCFPIFKGYYRSRLLDAKHDLREMETKHDNLNLCYKHRQEQNRSRYSEKNCDHCKLLKKLNPTEDS